MSYGFVYLLANRAMHGYYKVGCTERAPHQRAAELSGSTAVPLPFEVLCYIEIPDCQLAERQMHEWLADFRTNSNREFFKFQNGNMSWLAGMFKCHPYRVAFTECSLYEYVDECAPAVDPWGTGGDEPQSAPFAPGGIL